MLKRKSLHRSGSLVSKTESGARPVLESARRRETEPASPASTACQKARAGPEAVRVTMGPEPDSGRSADPPLGLSTSLAQRACLSPGGSPGPLHSSGDQLMRTEYELVGRGVGGGGGGRGQRQRERERGRETGTDGGRGSLCPRAEPDPATRFSRSYSGLRMTALLGQGLGKPLGRGEVARGFSSSSSTWVSLCLMGLTPAPGPQPSTPGSPSPLW